MFDDTFTSLTKDFETECEQIKYWCTALYDIKEQINSLAQIISKESTDLTAFSKYTSSLINIFITNTQQYSNEPSNLYKLILIFINILDLSIKYSLKTTENMNHTLSKNAPSIVHNLEGFIQNIISSSQSMMQEVIQLKTKSLEIQGKYAKSKDILNQAQVHKKKIENDPSTMYNDTIKGKATSRVLNSVQEMEGIMPDIKKYSKKLELKKEAFNTHMKDTFELVVMNVFKGIVYLHQFFYLISKQKLDDNLELKNIINDKINTGLRSNAISINDYSERKYAQANNIYYEPIHFTQQYIEHEIHNENVFSLIDSYTYYTSIFIDCMKMRKKLIDVLLKFSIDLNRYDTHDNNTNSTKTQKTIRDMLKNLQNIGHKTRKAWMIYQTYGSNQQIFQNSFASFVSSTALNILNGFITDTKNDYLQFNSEWLKFLKKLDKLKTKYIKQEEKQANKIKDAKGAKKEAIVRNKALIERENNIKTYLNTDCWDYLTKTIKPIREKDQKRAMDIANIIENLSHMLCKSIDESIELSRTEIENVTTMDMFEEINYIFTKYFEKFKITNYEGFMESIKIKLLTKIDFDKDETCQSTRESISGYLNQTHSNVNANSSFIRSNESFISNMNNNTLKHIDGIGGNDKSITKDSFEDDNAEENKIEFVNKNNFNVIEKKDNPYQNFKDKEIKQYMSKLNEIDSKNNINANAVDMNTGAKQGGGGVIIVTPVNKFNCQLSYKVKGYIYFTDNKIIFNSTTSKQQISIPLEDIVSLGKINTYANPNAIEFKTTKASLIFTNFTEQERCIKFITKQLEKMQKRNEGGDDPDVNNRNITMTKFQCQMINRNKAMKDLLDQISFLTKLDTISKERMSTFEKEYENHTKEPFFFQPEQLFDNVYIDCNDIGNKGPLSLIFHLFYNPSTIIEELNQGKSFFESVYLSRGDLNIALTFNEDDYQTIPQFFTDIDYSSGLFNNLNQIELEEFLNGISTWNKKFAFEMNFIHPISPMMGYDKITMKDKITIYFISPTDLIIDYHSFASDFPFTDSFISISQYRFHSDITFNQKEGMFKFKTSCKILYVIKFIKTAFFEGKIKSEGYKTFGEEVKFNIFEKMKNIIEIQSDLYCDMAKKLFDENVRRTIHKYSAVLPKGYDELNQQENKDNMVEISANDTTNVKTDGNMTIDGNNVLGQKEKKKSNTYIYFMLIPIVAIMVIKIGRKFFDSTEGFVISSDQIINCGILLLLGFLFYKVTKKDKS